MGVRGGKSPDADAFVSETLIIDASVIVFNKITILMIGYKCILLVLHIKLLKIHTLCNNTR